MTNNNNRSRKFSPAKTVVAIAIAAGIIISTLTYAAISTRPANHQDNIRNVSAIHLPAITAASPKANIFASNKSNSFLILANQTGILDWLTYHHDFFKTGFDPYHNPKSDSSSFPSIEKNWTSSQLDGAIYAEPLVSQHMVFAATENNSIYSLNADTGKVIWRTNLGPPVPLSDLPCGDIDPTGITGTPVIDMYTNTIFAVAFLRDTHSHELFALDLHTGRIRFETTVDPQGSDPMVQQQRGALVLSYYHNNSETSSIINSNNINNTSSAHINSTGFANEGTLVYIPLGGLFGDCGQYHGWVVGAPIPFANLSGGSSNNTIPNKVSNDNFVSINILGKGSEKNNELKQIPLLSFQVPTHREGGIWAPSGPAIDNNGSILVATGNSESSSDFDFGNSVIKLSPELEKVVDWFAPSNWADLDTSDTDLGSVGPAILAANINNSKESATKDVNGNNNFTAPGNNNSSSNIFQIGKEGVGFILRGDRLGGINGQVFSAPVCNNGAYGGTAFAAPYLYIPCRDGLVALKLQSTNPGSNNTNTTNIVNNRTVATALNQSKSNEISNNNVSNNNYSSFAVKWRGPSFWAGPPIVSGGLIWTVDLDNGTLYAFDQSSGNTLIQQDLGGNVVHFATPSSATGKIFVPVYDRIMSFSMK